MIRVLHVGNFSTGGKGEAFYNTDHKLSTGMTRIGCTVLDFSYRDVARQLSPFDSKWGGVARMNRQLIEVFQNFQPHVLLLGHAELVQPETLAVLRKIPIKTRILRWWVDSLDAHKMPAVRRPLPQVDVLFTSHGAQYTRDLLLQADPQAELPGTIAWLPPIADQAIDTGRAFENPVEELRYDLLFAGRPWPSRKSLHDELRRLPASYKLGIFGDNNNLLRGADYLGTIQKSRIGLNYSIYNDKPFYSSDRFMHLAANGVMVMSPRVPGLAEIFDKQGVVFFDDLSELPYLLEYWLFQERWRTAAEKSWKFVHSAFDCQRVARWILEVGTGLRSGEKFEWKEQRINT